MTHSRVVIRVRARLRRVTPLSLHPASKSSAILGHPHALRALAALVCALLLGSLNATTAFAQPYSGRTALPGGARSVVLQPPDTVATVAAAGGYGYTGPVLGEGDRHHRVAGRLALAIHPIDALSVGVRMAGYRDGHTGASGKDDSFVGDLGLFVLARLVHMGAFRLGVGAELWAAPGDGAGFEVGGLSPSLTVYSQFDLGSVALLARVGYLHDRSRETVPAGVVYSRGDQVSLGVTAADALLLGVGATTRVGMVDLYAELALDLLVRRSGVPLGASRSSLTLGAVLNLATRYQLGAELALNVGRYPEIRDDRLYRVDPRASILLSVTARLGALPTGSSTGVDEPTATVRGMAVDDSGTPTVGARVRLESTGETPVVVADTTTTADGAFVLSGVTSGEYDLVVSVDGRDDVRTRYRVEGDVDLAGVRIGTFSRVLRGRVEAPHSDVPVVARVLAGDTEIGQAQVGEDGTFTLPALPPGTLTLVVEGEGLTTHRVTVPPEQSGDLPVIELVEALPDGEIRGTVLGPGGLPVQARITIVPGDHEVSADAEGRFSVVITPGAHTVRVEADGYATQERPVTVEERGVVVLEVYLRAAR